MVKNIYTAISISILLSVLILLKGNIANAANIGGKLIDLVLNTEKYTQEESISSNCNTEINNLEENKSFFANIDYSGCYICESLKCKACKGSGKCNKCDGEKGFYRAPYGYIRCEHCEGTGKCNKCEGFGKHKNLECSRCDKNK